MQANEVFPCMVQTQFHRAEFGTGGIRNHLLVILRPVRHSPVGTAYLCHRVGEKD